MFLLILTLALALAGIILIEFGQAAAPRPLIFNDDLERRLLRTGLGSSNWW
jgi:hypothetical protein